MALHLHVDVGLFGNDDVLFVLEVVTFQSLGVVIQHFSLAEHLYFIGTPLRLDLLSNLCLQLADCHPLVHSYFEIMGRHGTFDLVFDVEDDGGDFTLVHQVVFVFFLIIDH